MVSYSGTTSASSGMTSAASSGMTSPSFAQTPPHQKLLLKVTNQMGGEDLYKIGVQLMTAYCQKRNMEYNTVRFIYNHKEIKPRQTPAQLKMEEGDEIFVVMELSGGGPCTP